MPRIRLFERENTRGTRIALYLYIFRERESISLERGRETASRSKNGPLRACLSEIKKETNPINSVTIAPAVRTTDHAADRRAARAAANTAVAHTTARRAERDAAELAAAERASTERAANERAPFVTRPKVCTLSREKNAFLFTHRPRVL